MLKTWKATKPGFWTQIFEFDFFNNVHLAVALNWRLDLEGQGYTINE